MIRLSFYPCLPMCRSIFLFAVFISNNGHAADVVHPSSTPIKTFNVKTYGAKGDGETDDQLAINKTLLDAQVWTSSDANHLATVYFPAGTYSLTHLFGAYAINILNTKNITFEGESCPANTRLNYCVKLMGAPASYNANAKNISSNSFFYIKNSSNIQIHNFYLDKKVPYFSQGKVLAVNSQDKTVDLRTDAGYAGFDDPVINNLYKLFQVFTDPQLRYWDHSDAACAGPKPASSSDPNCYNFHILAKRSIGQNIWRITLDKMPPQTFLNMPYLMWKSGWPPGFMVEHSNNVTAENIFYTGGGGPAVRIWGSSGNNIFRNFTVDVPQNSKRLFAAGSGFNGTKNYGQITLDHVSVAHTDDDAFHFSAGPYFPSLQQSEDRRIVRLALCYDGDFKQGNKITAWRWDNKTPIMQATIVSVKMVTDSNPAAYPRSCEITLDQPLPALANMRTYDDSKIGALKDTNDRIFNTSFNASLVVSDSYLSSMRARCGIIQVPALVVRNTCQNTILAGFLVGPEYSWGEGYAVNNVQITSNLFDNVGGTAIYVANISDSNNSSTYQQITDSIKPAINIQQDNKNIIISNNKFSNLGMFGHGIMGVRGLAISLQNADTVQITNNNFGSSVVRDAPADIAISPTTTSHVRK